MKLGNKKDIILGVIEPLTQANIITANPIPGFAVMFAYNPAFKGL